jgi:formate dehydrogenase major subunit
VDERLCDYEFIKDRVEGWNQYQAFIGSWSPEAVAGVTGVPPDAIRKAARLYATKKPAMIFHGLGVTEHEQGTHAVMSLVNLALLTGSFGKRGCGVNPLRGQNNVQGGAHMGCEPDHLTGYAPLGTDAGRFEQLWGARVPRRRGLNLLEMMDAARKGTLKALWIVGYDIGLTNPDARTTREALRSLDFVVVQDIFLNETAKEFGSVFLPAASSFEKDGTYMNAERRVGRVRKALDPIGASKPDWEIVCLLAREMGAGSLFDFRSPEDIWNEVRTAWRNGAGISYARLEQGGIQWPCPSEAHPGTAVLHASTFGENLLATLQCIGYSPGKETTDETCPFVLLTGRSLYQFNAGTMTMRTRNRALRPSDYLDISASDARHLDVTDGDLVQLESAHGRITLPVRITSEVEPGTVFATFQVPELSVNDVTAPWRDSVTNTPAYKKTAVGIYRHGHRNVECR